MCSSTGTTKKDDETLILKSLSSNLHKPTESDRESLQTRSLRGLVKPFVWLDCGLRHFLRLEQGAASIFPNTVSMRKHRAGRDGETYGKITKNTFVLAFRLFFFAFRSFLGGFPLDFYKAMISKHTIHMSL